MHGRHFSVFLRFRANFAQTQFFTRRGGGGGDQFYKLFQNIMQEFQIFSCICFSFVIYPP